MRFGEPWALLMLLPWALVALYLVRRPGWKTPEIPVPALRARPRPGGTRAHLAGVAGRLLPLATFLFLIAAARPQAGPTTRATATQGIESVIAADVSARLRCGSF